MIIAKPFITVLKKGSYGWNLDALNAFKRLKLVVTFAPMLALPNFNHDFVVETKHIAMEWWFY